MLKGAFYAALHERLKDEISSRDDSATLDKLILLAIKLDQPWVSQHNPQINWPNNGIDTWSPFGLKNCLQPRSSGKQSFGLCNAAAVFQNLVNNVLRDFLHKFIFIYLDDILIFSQNLEDHKNHVRQVIQCLMENHL